MTDQIISNQTFDEERALYHLQDAEVSGCTFAGPADGESVLKETRRIAVTDCRFSLRYPLWHAQTFRLENSSMDVLVRAPIWYSCDGTIAGCQIDGGKLLRECDRIQITDTRICSEEFGWKCRDLTIQNCRIESEYLLFESERVAIDRMEMTGKYSFQYMDQVTIANSVLDTKDALWHSRNVTVTDSVVKGEYLGWYSDGLTFINCRIIGTQPLCYCKNLTLVDCTMEETDLAFEYSDVQANIRGTVLSVKNPRSGRITADGFGEIIREGAVMEDHCQVCVRG